MNTKTSTVYSSILVCVNYRDGHEKSCAGSGSQALLEAINKKLISKNLDIEVQTLKCFGRCHNGPVLRVAPGGDFFENFSVEQIDKLVDYIMQPSS